MKLLKPAMLLGAAVVLLGSGASEPSPQEIRDAQLASPVGPTSGWQLSAAPWAASTQAMRDRAYSFCLSRHPGDKTCPVESDDSLIAAHHAENYVEIQSAGPVAGDARGAALAEHPELFEHARALCFSVYEDAGRADVRGLGPCLSNATGGDYFGTLPVR